MAPRPPRGWFQSPFSPGLLPFTLIFYGKVLTSHVCLAGWALHAYWGREPLMSKRLVVVYGPDEGRVFEIPATESLLLGRSRASDAHLIDPHVARVHCQVQQENGQVFLSDFDSPAGTWLNGQQIRKQQLKPGDVIRIGMTQLQFYDEEPKPPPKRGKTRLLVPTSFAPEKLVGHKFSEYKLMSLLARGQAGYVYHGRDLRKNRPVAVKVLLPELARDKQLVQRFAKAMKMAMPLRHPNLIATYTAGKSGPYLWIVMEYLASESLAAVIGRIPVAGQLDWRTVLRIAVLTARALDYVHRKKIVHRNLNPQNILFGNNPKDTKLTDLMLATSLEGKQGGPIRRREHFHADVPYMSPERTRGLRLDARADIYSLGATIYAMLTGRPPFDAPTLQELLAKIHSQQPPPLREQGTDVPKFLEDLVIKMLNKDLQQRPQDTGGLLRDMENFAQAQGVQI